MRRAFLFAPLTIAAGTCMAQSGVTLYGLADAGVVHVTGLRGGSVNQLASGVMEGSRVGLKGSEDLGGRYRAIFTLEHRLELDTGATSNRPQSGSQLPDRIASASVLLRDQPVPLQTALQPVISAVSNGIGATLGVNLAGNFWDRQAFVGLVTPFGAILAGRMYTPAYEVNYSFDTMRTQSSLSAGQVASIPPSVDIRVSNAIQYRIELPGATASDPPKLKASVMAAAGEGSASTGRFLGAMAVYTAGNKFSIGGGHNRRDNERGERSLTSTVAGAWVRLGPGELVGEVAKIKDDRPSGLGAALGAIPVAIIGPANAALLQSRFTEAFKQDAHLYHAGYRMTGFGPGVDSTLYVAFTRLNDKRPDNADTSSYGVAYSYGISRRTDINAVVTRLRNSGLGQVAPGGNGYLGGVTASAGTDSTSLALSLRHRF